MADDTKPVSTGGAPAPKALLTVHENFEDYERGDQITDQKEADRVSAAYPYFVTKLA